MIEENRQTIKAQDENNMANSPLVRKKDKEISRNILDERLSIKITDMLSKEESITDVFQSIAAKFNRKHSVSLKVQDISK